MTRHSPKYVFVYASYVLCTSRYILSVSLNCLSNVFVYGLYESVCVLYVLCSFRACCSPQDNAATHEHHTKLYDKLCITQEPHWLTSALWFVNVL